MSNAALIHLGSMLRDLRRKSGLTGVELSSQISLSQSAISKLETGKARIPEWSLLESILESLSVTQEEYRQVRRQYELAQLDPSSYLYLMAHGSGAKQQQMAALEAESTYIRDFQTTVVPGLLQTPAYSYAVFRELGYTVEASSISTRERQLRQIVLNDPRRRFEFIVLDSALYSRRGKEQDYVQQIEYLLSRISANNIFFRILDSRKGVPVRLSNPFEIIDRRFVSAEAAIQEMTTSQPIEVESYERLFKSFWTFSLDEKDSIKFLKSLI